MDAPNAKAAQGQETEDDTAESGGGSTAWTRDGATESHRRYGFFIATLLISGFLFLLAIPIVRSDIPGAKDLAGIFSGWIVAIVGFYFIQGQARDAAAAAEAKGAHQGKLAVSETEAAIQALQKENSKLRRELAQALNTIAEH